MTSAPQTLSARSKHLRQEALVTDALPTRDSHERAGRVWSERREALQLLEQWEAKNEATQKQFVGFESRVFELAGLAARGSNGLPWLKELPVEARSEFFQKFHALVRWAAEQSKAAQTT